MDDRDAIVANPTIRSLSLEALHGPFQTSTAGRPLVNLSLALNYAVGGLDPSGYHAVNLAIHILCGLLLFGIVRRTLQHPERLRHPAPLAAFFVSLIWLVHPLQSELINYVTQRTESLMALALLLTLYAFIRGSASKHPSRWFTLAVVTCMAGMLCKESMATAPVMLLAYDAVFCAGSVRKALRERGLFYAGIAMSYVVLGAVVISGGRSHSAGFASGVSPWTYFLNQGPIVLRYLRLAFWPSALVFDYGLPKPITLGAALPAGLVVIALLIGALTLWQFNRALAYVATWFFVTLAPTSTIVPIATEVGAERRMYLPLAALVALAVLALLALVRQRTLVTVTVAGLSCVLGIVTFHRTTDYFDQLALWRQVVARYPHGRAHYNLGLQLRDAGQRDAALHEFQIAVPDLPDAEYALAFEAMTDRRYDEAATRLRSYLQRAPLDINAIRASNLLGRALLESGHPDEAIAAFRETLRMQPTNTDAMSGRGEAQMKLGNFAEAAMSLLESTRRAPDNGTAHYNLGVSLLNLQRFDEAVAELAAAVRLNPNDPAAHANLGTSLAQLRRYDEAIAEFRRAQSMETDPAARQEIDRVIADIEAEKNGAGHH